MSGEKQGLATALEMAEAAGIRMLHQQNAQLPLLETGLDGEGALMIAEARKGPGRPPGALNKRTADMVAYLRARYRDPLTMLAETYSRSAKALALELGCTLLEAFKLQQEAVRLMLPYMHSKQPIAVDLTKTDRLIINIWDGEEPGEDLAAAGDPDGLVIVLDGKAAGPSVLEKVMENQQLSGSEE